MWVADLGDHGHRAFREQLGRQHFEAYAAQSGGSDPEALMVVVQLTDHDGDTPPVLAVAPMIDGLSSRQRMFDCEGGCHHDAERAGGRGRRLV